jgi:hypothetical protein
MCSGWLSTVHHSIENRIPSVFLEFLFKVETVNFLHVRETLKVPVRALMMKRNSLAGIEGAVRIVSKLRPSVFQWLQIKFDFIIKMFTSEVAQAISSSKLFYLRHSRDSCVICTVLFHFLISIPLTSYPRSTN